MALNAQRQTQLNTLMLKSSLQKLASGYRVNSAGDDAAGLAISEAMRAQITGTQRAMMNAQDGVSFVQTAEGALSEVHSMLNRLTDLSVQAANGILSDEQRAGIQGEADAITSEIDRIAESTNFNGKKILDGSLMSTPLTLQVGETAPETVDVGIDSMSSASLLGTSGINLTTVGGASLAQTAVRSAVNLVSATRGDIGAIQNSLEHTVSNLGVKDENIQAAESRIRDADMALTLLEFTKRNVLQQSGMGMQAHALIQSQQVLQMLR
jgi:flagellin